MSFLGIMKKEIIKLFVKPGSSKTEIAGMHDGMVKIRISSPAEKGKANRELVSFLSLKLQIPKKDIKITSGELSNIKTLEIKGIFQDSLKNLIIEK